MNAVWDPYLLTAASLAVSATLTGVARRVAARTGVLDRPDGARKLHRDPTPLLGGAAIFLTLGVVLGVAVLLPSSAAVLRTLQAATLPALLISGGLFCGLGLYDDIRPMRPWRKLVCQFLASMPFAIWGQKVSWVEFLGIDLTLGPAVGAVVTMLWIVACVNTINLIDGLDGLAATVGLITCIGIALIADLQSLPAATLIALIAAGSLTGFLCHNLPPARIFLGDGGSLLIGFLIAALAIESNVKTAAGFAMTVPMILVSVPAFDTVMAILRRRLTGRGIGEGDRGHIHHRLQERGLTRTQTLVVIAGLCGVMATLTVLSVYFNADRLCLALCATFLGLLIVGRVFGHYEALLFLRKAQRIGQVLISGSTLFGRPPGRAAATWIELVEAVRMYGASRLELILSDRRTGAVVDRRHAVERHSSAPAWEFRASARGVGACRLELVASGDRVVTSEGLAALSVLLHDCCRQWADAGSPPAESVAPGSRAASNRPKPSGQVDQLRQAA